MITRMLAAAAVLLMVLGSAHAVAATPGVAKSAVNLRTGPGAKYARITTIPAGARVSILRCGRWCEVVYAGRRGWASAPYIARGAVPRGYVLLPDRSMCHGAAAYELPFCEWPIERSVREFNRSTWDYNHRQSFDRGHGGRRK
ncbi:MAG: SH3 domain-containing protein [Bauldia sp.]|nr:SH3 domain-containing protein [Bauldia sp.]